MNVLDRHFGIQQFNLSLAARVKLKFLGEVYVFHAQKQGWTGALPFYIVKCDVHGYFLDYPHGFEPYFSCPKCWEELEESLKQTQKIRDGGEHDV